MSRASRGDGLAPLIVSLLAPDVPCNSTLSAPLAAAGAEVTLVSAEGVRFVVPKRVAQLSELVKTMTDEGKTGAVTQPRRRPWALARHKYSASATDPLQAAARKCLSWM